ncbi:MAG: type VI secretion system lipoprotein TssJ [Methylococcaceae bacterium]
MKIISSLSFMKHTLFLALAILISLQMTGCSRSVNVKDADAFVGAAFKEAMAEVAERKQRPSQVAFSFYADEDVNAIIKKHVEKTYHVLELYDDAATEKQLTSYRLQCDKVMPYTYRNCRSKNQSTSDKHLTLQFEQIQLLKKKQLKIQVKSSDQAEDISNQVVHHLQCSDKSLNFYANCTSVSENRSFSIKRLKILEVQPDQYQLEIQVQQSYIKDTQTASKAVTVTPTAAPVPCTKWVDSYIDAKPISFKVLMLRDNSLLLSADKESLDNDLENTLGKNYIDHYDYVLTPGQFKFVNYTRLDADVRYIGIIADYRNGSNSVWKKIYKVEPNGSLYPLHIHLTRKEVKILAEQE